MVPITSPLKSATLCETQKGRTKKKEQYGFLQLANGVNQGRRGRDQMEHIILRANQEEDGEKKGIKEGQRQVRETLKPMNMEMKNSTKYLTYSQYMVRTCWNCSDSYSLSSKFSLTCALALL
ncbi:hypothetical protein V6N12_041450 [Hibiscus sabdariffa]|uniref:Uncharacterized protein n=1 Tax=Hibiscus sabdariffa TaxID=183260 RepID=A0ABR2AI01_9ROSI